jgi:hypothetical protein
MYGQEASIFQSKWMLPLRNGSLPLDRRFAKAKVVAPLYVDASARAP